ncbi:MAG: hypothetical protein Q8L08_08125 [Candidatus Nanopelagicaceae bacterium]|nr:hypothetical protein [Candidatus Nanopelagicaceae bacterium]
MAKAMTVKGKTATTSKSKKKLTIDRKIRFYRADLGSQAKSKATLDLTQVLSKVDKLPWTKGGKRYMSVDSEHILSFWVDSASEQQMSLGIIRQSDFPLIESGGELLSLDLGDGDGLCERIHLKIFPNNIVGEVYNFYGPRSSQLHGYLESTGIGAIPDFKLDPLLRADAELQISGVSVIRSLEMSIRPAYVFSVIQADQTLGKAFKASTELGASKRITIRWVADVRASEGLGPTVLQAVRKVLRRTDLQDNVKQFKMRGFNTQTESIDDFDLLRDQFIVSKSILRLDSRSRALSDEDAYAAIQSAYDGLKDELEAAASVQTN